MLNLQLDPNFYHSPPTKTFQKTQHASSGTRESVHEEVVIFFQQQYK